MATSFLKSLITWKICNWNIVLMCTWILILRYTFIYIYIWVVYMSQSETYHVCMCIYFSIYIFIPCGYLVDSNLCCTYIYIYLHIHIFAYSYTFTYAPWVFERGISLLKDCVVERWSAYAYMSNIALVWATESLWIHESEQAYAASKTCAVDIVLFDVWPHAPLTNLRMHVCMHTHACSTHSLNMYVRVTSISHAREEWMHTKRILHVFVRVCACVSVFSSIQVNFRIYQKKIVCVVCVRACVYLRVHHTRKK